MNQSSTPDTIVLIHGFWVTPRSWEQWIPRYEAKGFRVLAPAYPGFEVEVEALNPLLGRHFVVGQNIMLARVLLRKGCIVPEHSHPNEQLTFIAEGALKFWIDGKEIVVNAGEVLTIPPNMPHKAEALEDTVDFDVFNPPRADWMSGTDVYLR